MHTASLTALTILAAFAALTGCSVRPSQTTEPVTVSNQQRVLISFGSSHESFRAVDDRVMGGVSRSGMGVSASGHGVFEGDMSLESNGGFASVRSRGLTLDLGEAGALALRVRGDGKRYKLRLHDDSQFDGVAYQVVFETQAGEWMELEFPIDAFRPVWRGRDVPGAAPLDRARVTSVGLMISDGQEGAFALEVDWLAAR